MPRSADEKLATSETERRRSPVRVRQLTGRECTDRHGAVACGVTCQVVIFVCPVEHDGNGNSPRLELTAQREPTRRKEVGSAIDDTAWIRAVSGARRKRNGSERGENEERRIRAVAWLGSD